MLRAFVFNETAVVVRHWYEVGPDDDEHGARLELRRLAKHNHRGSESAPQRIDIDGIVWRADLFDLVGDPPGTYRRAHYHDNFDGLEPQGRSWDDALTANPFGWIETQLGDVAGLVGASGVALTEPERESADIRNHLPDIIAAALKCAPVECRSPAECMAATRDTGDIVQMMVSLFRTEAAHGRDPRTLPV
jgi:hypothetical protein